MDMSPAYVKGVNSCCRNTEIVFDKFHIIANVNKAIDKVRSGEIRKGGKGIGEQLKQSCWLWRKNQKSKTPELLSVDRTGRQKTFLQRNLHISLISITLNSS
jgi:transposase